MRERVLLASVRRCLRSNDVVGAAFMWRPGRLTLPFACAAAAGCALLAYAGGFDSATHLAAIGLAGGAVAWLASTEYRVLALTGDGLAQLLEGSRIRHVATGVADEPIDRATIRPVSANAMTSQWWVGRRQYTVLRRHQRLLASMSTAAT